MPQSRIRASGGPHCRLPTGKSVNKETCTSLANPLVHTERARIQWPLWPSTDPLPVRTRQSDHYGTTAVCKSYMGNTYSTLYSKALKSHVFQWNTWNTVEYMWNTRICIPLCLRIPVEYMYSISLSSYSPSRFVI